MPAAPQVSVVMPVYNAQRYLAEALQSVLSQTFTDFELIVVDDGSKDESLSIIKRVAGRDPRLKLISRPNTGIVGALTDGIEAARAEVIARMDADDVCLPQRFERQVEFLRNHPDHCLVGSRVTLIDPDGLPIGTWATQTTHEEIDQAHLDRRWPVVHPTVMMRRAAVMAVGGYRKQYNTLEDLDLFLRLAEHGRLANVPEVLLLYRQHFGSTCFERTGTMNDIRERIFKETYERRGMTVDVPEDAYRAAPRSKHSEATRWAWMALKEGHVATSRKYARLVIAARPASLESWRLLYCALRGR